MNTPPPPPGVGGVRADAARTALVTRACRSRRPGLAQTQLLILGAVIAAIVVLSVGGFAVYRSVTRGAEDNAAKANIDRVLAAAEDYWQQYALKRDGTREVSYLELCDYMNARFTVEDDLILRSAAVVVGTNSGSPSQRNNYLVEKGAFALNHVAPASVLDDRQAQCDLKVNAAGLSGHIDGTGKLDVQFSASNGTAPSRAMSVWQSAGLKLGSTRGIFMMPAEEFDETDPSATTPTGWAAATPVAALPAGADNLTEAFVVGAVSSSGNTFCAVKVFDADNRAHIGNYRYASSPDDDGPRIPEPCHKGIPPTDEDEADSGWKSAN